ncbi:hypothetical protein [Hydrogenophaga sp.]|uniref:hypothetical protein n=1 Tax=Hydrogenophaga sp. TaxID=1904254 RepID=UPI003F73058E
MEESLAAWIDRVDSSADVAQFVEALASYRGGPPISDADGKSLTSWANGIAMHAISTGIDGVITAIALTGIDQMKAGLLTHDPDRGYTPACLAAALGNDAAFTELANTGIPHVLTKGGTHRFNYFTPADTAAHYGNGNVIAALADTDIPEVLASLSKSNPMDQCTPAERAVLRGKHEAISALARIEDPQLRASMTGRGRYGHLSHLAALRGHASVIDALANSGVPELANTLSMRLNATGPTPAEMAAESGFPGVIAALANSKNPKVIATLSEDPSHNRGPTYLATSNGKPEVIEALAETEIPALLDIFKEKGVSLAASARRLGHNGTADAIQEAMTFANELPRDEKALLEALHGDLVASDRQHDGDLVTDTQCFITAQPFATVGPRRPVYLHDQKGVPDGRHCISHSATRHLIEGAAKNPFTNLAFTGFAEAPDRVALIRDLVETCRQNPDATPQDRVYKALSLYKAHSESAAGVPRAEQPVPQYETVLAAAAGAGARPPSRRAAEP